MKIPRIFPLILFVLLLFACGEPDLPELPPDEIVQNSAEQMQSLPGFHFAIAREGAPAFVDPPDNALSFRRAAGDYTAPDRAQAVVRVIAPGLVTDVNVISVGEIQWQTNPLTGKWEELPPNWGFNPTVLFDSDVGLQAILANDTSNLQLVEGQQLEDGPDQPLYALTGTVAGERLAQMSNGLIGNNPAQIQLWVVPETFELVRVVLTETNTGTDEYRVWQVDFSEWGEVVAIEPPQID